MLLSDAELDELDERITDTYTVDRSTWGTDRADKVTLLTDRNTLYRDTFTEPLNNMGYEIDGVRFTNFESDGKNEIHVWIKERNNNATETVTNDAEEQITEISDELLERIADGELSADTTAKLHSATTYSLRPALEQHSEL